MTVDVDINERLNGLVTLLNVVGIDGVDASALTGTGSSNKARDGSQSTPSTQGTSGSSDAQILEIIKKLQQAQADSPEILAALKSPEFRALATLAAQKGGAAPAPAPAAPTLDEVMEDDDNYPKIGPGYSDDISVASDLTTPTVMTKQQVADEEYYRDVNGGPGALPPLNIALGPGPAPPSRPQQLNIHGASAPPPAKTKNLVSQVRSGVATRRAIARSGGAAAQRRLNYQQAMAKLQPTEQQPHSKSQAPRKQSYAASAQDPSEFPSMADNKKGRGGVRKVTDKKKSSKKTALAAQEEADDDAPDVKKSSSKKKSSSSSSSHHKKEPRTSSSGAADSSGWPAFDEGAKSSKGKSDPFAADNFFSSNAFGNSFSSNKSAGSDPFAPSTGSDPFSDTKTRSRKHSTDDPFADGGAPMVKSSSSRRKDKDWSSSTKKEKSKKGKSSRRASLSM